MPLILVTALGWALLLTCPRLTCALMGFGLGALAEDMLSELPS